jgi:hypothetical protein
MSDTEKKESFFGESINLVKDYADTRTRILRLQGIRFAAKTGGAIIWAVISMFLLFLVLVFIGITAGFWFSSLTGSYIYGFGLATLLLILITLLLAAVRKSVFINPLVKKLIRESGYIKEEKKE